MRKKAVLLSLVLCTFALNCLVMPTRVEAMETISICSLSAPITEENIINAEIIDGELYIDVLTEIDPNQMITLSEIGPCPQTYKTISKGATRSELVQLKSELNTREFFTDLIISAAFGPGGWIAGIVGSALAGSTKDMMLAAVENALDNNGKNYFTITSKFKCEEGNLGSRGIVHRYRLVSVEVK